MKKGDYADERIIRLRKICQGGTESHDLLADAVPIREKEIRFRWFSLFDGKFRMPVPETFTVMPEQIAKVRYPCIYRPPIILTGPGYDENLGFRFMDCMEDVRKAGDDGTDMDRLLQRMQDTVRRYTPEAVIYERGRFGLCEMEGGWFEYKNFTVDEETYNMQFIFRAGNGFLIGTFNCRMVFYGEWKPWILKALEHTEWMERSGRTDESR